MGSGASKCPAGVSGAGAAARTAGGATLAPPPHPPLSEGFYMALGEQHSPAPLPPSEDLRHKCLCEANLLDTEREDRFDDITALLAKLFSAPIALVSIVDSDRQWFKSVVGLPVRQTPRTVSFCAWTLVNHVPQVLVIQDARKDARFVNNPLTTGEPFVIFYCGSPIIASSGHRLGSLCIIDNHPRSVSSEACVFLSNMADIVAREIDDPRGKVNNQTAIMILNTGSSMMPVEYVNSIWQKTCEMTKEEAVGLPIFELFTFFGKNLSNVVYAAVSSGKETRVEVKCNRTRGEYNLLFKSAFSEVLFDDSFVIGAPAHVPRGRDKDSYGIKNSIVFVVLEPTAPDHGKAESHFQILPMAVPAAITLGTPIGRGSYATVYRGKWNKSEVAVKVYKSTGDIAEDNYLPIQEAELTRSLSHPNVINLYHYEKQKRPDGSSVVWMCLEICEMGTLSNSYQNGFFRDPVRQWSLDMQKLLMVAYQVASAMAYVHGQGIVHSDLTCNNILLKADAHAEYGFVCKLADFGIAKRMDNRAFINTECHGTVTHMAPELLMDCRLSFAADVYSFGIMLWEIYHSKRPFEGMVRANIIAQVALKEMRPAIAEDCPMEYAAMIEQCWASEDEDRPTFESLKEQIQNLRTKQW